MPEATRNGTSHGTLSTTITSKSPVSTTLHVFTAPGAAERTTRQFVMPKECVAEPEVNILASREEGTPDSLAAPGLCTDCESR